MCLYFKMLFEGKEGYYTDFIKMTTDDAVPRNVRVKYLSNVTVSEVENERHFETNDSAAKNDV